MNLSERIETIKSDEKKARLDSKKYLFGIFGSAIGVLSPIFYGCISPESFYDNLFLNVPIIIASNMSMDLCFLAYQSKKDASKSLREKYRSFFDDEIEKKGQPV